jgi:hypothetical protein
MMSGTGCAPRRSWSGICYPRLLGQSEYNERVKAAAPLMEAALRRARAAALRKLIFYRGGWIALAMTVTAKTR